MKKTGKILYTDIMADRNREESLDKYLHILASSFYHHSAIRLSLNMFTMHERLEDITSDRKAEIEKFIKDAETALKSTITDSESDHQANLNLVNKIRDDITQKMNILTAYTDTIELYEYILNRKEGAIKGTSLDYIDTDELAENMFQFVFSDNDKVLVNTKIQEFVAQLPVRLTTQRFYDIVSNSMAIYRGGEKSALDDFVTTIREVSLLELPDGFATEYPEIVDAINALKNADYKNLSEADFDTLTSKLKAASEHIEYYVNDYIIIAEVLNDILIMLMCHDLSIADMLPKNFETAKFIIEKIIDADDIYEAAPEFDEKFIHLEGAEDDSYDTLISLEANLDELKNSYSGMTEAIDAMFETLTKADRLTSNSLFADINKDFTVVMDEADEAYIAEKKDALLAEFDEYFKTLDKSRKRSVIAKVLSKMPVFFNTQDEIKEYFKYALSVCGDDSELTAVKNIVDDLMFEE